MQYLYTNEEYDLSSSFLHAGPANAEQLETTDFRLSEASPAARAQIMHDAKKKKKLFLASDETS
mgnify:CR=1 FL=1